jgi:hypothetical protein
MRIRDPTLSLITKPGATNAASRLWAKGFVRRTQSFDDGSLGIDQYDPCQGIQ